MKIARRILMSLLCAFAAHALPANATFTFTPSAVGLTGAAVTADNILLSEFVNFTFTDTMTFSETGFLSITGFQLGGSDVTAGGLNSTYSLYFQFFATGHLTTGTSSTDLRTTPTAGVLDTLSYSLVGGSGNTTFSFTGTTPTVTPGGATQTLATGALLNGHVMTTPANGNTAFVPSMTADLTFSVFPGKDGFFSPNPFPNMAFTTSSIAVDTVETFGTGGPGSGFLIDGGGGNLNFAPEPATLALVGLGLAGLALTRRRRSL